MKVIKNYAHSPKCVHAMVHRRAALLRGSWGCWLPRLVLVSSALSCFPWWVTPVLRFGSRSRYCYGVCGHAHAALCVWLRLVEGLCTVGCAVRGAGAWLGVVWRSLLVRWCLGALSGGMVWGALVGSVVAAGVRCGRRCRLRCRLGWCTRRAFMARRCFVLVPVHMGVCCAGGVPAGRCRLLCVVFPVLCMCAATCTRCKQSTHNCPASRCPLHVWEG